MIHAVQYKDDACMSRGKIKTNLVLKDHRMQRSGRFGAIFEPRHELKPEMKGGKDSQNFRMKD